MFGSGKVSLEASLEREVYYHGEDIPLTISINNQSKKAVKNIRVKEKYFPFYTREFGGSAVCPVQCHISQNCELSMVNGQYSCKVARLDSQDGCPVNSGSR